MGQIKGNNKFKSKSTYIIHFVIYVVGIYAFVWILFRLINLTEQELIIRYAEQELIGGASQRGAQTIQRFLVDKFGKEGLIAALILLIIGVFYELLKEIFEYFRFKKKNQLYKQGLTDNLNDDYQPKGVIRTIKSFFARNRTSRGIKK